MPVVDNIIGIVRGIKDRQQAAQVDEQLKNYLTSPDETIKAIMPVDPRFGVALQQQRTAEKSTAVAAQQNALKAQRERVDGAIKLMRGLPKGTDISALTPVFKNNMGLDDNDIGVITGLAGSGVDFASLDDESWKAMVKGQYDTTVATPGSHVIRDGEVIDRVPFAPRTVTTRGGDGSARTDIFDPTTGDFITQGGGGEPAAAGGGFSGDLSLDTLRPMFVAQESSGNYGAVNKDTGALGRYQVMPDTGKALAQRLGLAWRPDMMKKDDPASRRYQDAIGDAAIQEAIDAGGGDPEKIFSYYYSGNADAYAKPGNPKTTRYTGEMMDRLSGGRGGARAPITMPGKPGKSVRAATQEEIAAAGYPAGTAAQIDASTGEFVNLKTPPASAQAKPMTPKQRQDMVKAKTALPVIREQWGRLGREVSKLLNNPDLPLATGAIQGRVPSWLPVPGMQARTDVEAKLNTIKSQIAINALKEMRASSPTGGALGNVSNQDMKTLENSINSLDLSQSDEQFRESLQEILQLTQDAPVRAEEAFAALQEEFGVGQEDALGAGPQLGTIIKNPKTGERMRLTGSGWEKIN